MSERMEGTPSPAAALGLWALIEEEIAAGRRPDPRHVAHALRAGAPVTLSSNLQAYLAALIDKTPRPLNRGKSKGAKYADAYALVSHVEELTATEAQAQGKRGAQARAFAKLGSSAERKYWDARKLVRGKKSGKHFERKRKLAKP